MVETYWVSTAFTSKLLTSSNNSLSMSFFPYSYLNAYQGHWTNNGVTSVFFSPNPLEQTLHRLIKCTTVKQLCHCPRLWTGCRTQDLSGFLKRQLNTYRKDGCSFGGLWSRWVSSYSSLNNKSLKRYCSLFWSAWKAFTVVGAIRDTIYYFIIQTIVYNENFHTTTIAFLQFVWETSELVEIKQ